MVRSQNMHWIALISLVTSVLGQVFTIPSTLRSCEPTTVSWRTPSNSTDDLWYAFVSISTMLEDGLKFTVTWLNISRDGVTFNPVFKPGSVVVPSELGPSDAKDITVEDSGRNDCLLDYNTSVVPIPANPIATGPLTFVSSEFQATQCKKISLAWLGGIPPYQLTVLNHPQSNSIIVIEIDNITSTELDIRLPLQANEASGFAAYTLVVKDGAFKNATADILITPTSPDQGSAGADAECLIEPLPESSPSASGSPASPSESTASLSSNGASGPSHGKTILAIVVPIVLALLLIPIVLVIYRHHRRKVLTRKTQVFKNRLEHRTNAIKLDEVSKGVDSSAQEQK